jgi:hypothetical protein
MTECNRSGGCLRNQDPPLPCKCDDPDSFCHLVDDGGPEVVAVKDSGSEVEIPGALWVRVGPVWDGATRRSEPGVWINYQSHC